MSILLSCRTRNSFIDSFYERKLSKRDLAHFDINAMEPPPFPVSFFGELIGIAERNRPDQLQDLYFAVRFLRRNIQPKTPGSEELYKKNITKLFRMAFPLEDIADPVTCDEEPLVQSLMESRLEDWGAPEEIVLKDLGAPTEVILEQAGFPEDRIVAFMELLQSMPRYISGCVKNMEQFLEQEAGSEPGEKPVVPVFQLTTTQDETKYSGKLSELGNKVPLEHIPNEDKSLLLTEISAQLWQDFNRRFRVAAVHRGTIHRFFVPNAEGLSPEQRMARSAEKAHQMRAGLLQFIKDVNLTAREQLIFLDYSTQTAFNHASVPFMVHYLPKIQGFLQGIDPAGEFHSCMKDVGQIYHYLTEKKTTCAQTVEIVNIFQSEGEKKADPILEFKMSSTFYWDTELMVLDKVELVAADARPLFF